MTSTRESAGQGSGWFRLLKNSLNKRNWRSAIRLVSRNEFNLEDKKTMHLKHDKLDIADEMLEGAITAFLDSKQLFVALNLAGVAEELYGKVIRINGGMNSQSSLIELAKTIATRSGVGELTDRDFFQISVEYKNGIKHLDTEEQRFIEIDIEDEARATIGCALTNHNLLGRQFTPTIQRFYEFGRTWSLDAAKALGDATYPIRSTDV